MARMNTDSFSISLTAMLSSFALLFLYLSSVLPTAKLSMYAIASLFTIPICMEHRTLNAFIMFIVVSLLSLLILPNFMAVAPYLLFFGHYGILKFHAEEFKDKILAFAIKLAYFNIILVLTYFVIRSLILEVVPDVLKDHVWAFIVTAQIVFVVYDIIYSKFAEIYDSKFRPFLIKKGRR